MYQEDLDIRQITNADTLRQMLAQCEDEIMRLSKDGGDSSHWPRWPDNDELIREELSTRACILNHMFALHCTPSEVKRFEEVNTALLQLEKMHRLWHNHLHNQFAAIRGLDGGSFDLDTAVNGSFDDDTPLYTMEEDSYYGSRWREMLNVISENSVIDAMTDLHDDVEDGVSWAEGPLSIPQLEHVCVCYLIHALCTHLHYSIPDILRMTTYRIDYRMDCSDFITVTPGELISLTPGEPEPFTRVPLLGETDKETIDRILYLNELFKGSE